MQSMTYVYMGASCVMFQLIAFSRLNCCGADPWAAIGWSRRIHQ